MNAIAFWNSLAFEGGGDWGLKTETRLIRCLHFALQYKYQVLLVTMVLSYLSSRLTQKGILCTRIWPDDFVKEAHAHFRGI